MPKLPRANAIKHIAAFKRAGWIVNHIEGSYHILVKAGSQIHLSIPVHAGKELLDIGLLRRLIEKADMTQEECCMYFSKKI